MDKYDKMIQELKSVPQGAKSGMSFWTWFQLLLIMFQLIGLNSDLWNPLGGWWNGWFWALSPTLLPLMLTFAVLVLGFSVAGLVMLLKHFKR